MLLIRKDGIGKTSIRSVTSLQSLIVTTIRMTISTVQLRTIGTIISDDSMMAPVAPSEKTAPLSQYHKPSLGHLEAPT